MSNKDRRADLEPLDAVLRRVIVRRMLLEGPPPKKEPLPPPPQWARRKAHLPQRR